MNENRQTKFYSHVRTNMRKTVVKKLDFILNVCYYISGIK